MIPNAILMTILPRYSRCTLELVRCSSDRVGHVKLLESCASSGNHGFATELGVYASIQSAIDAATDGDAVFIGAGAHCKQLTIR